MTRTPLIRQDHPPHPYPSSHYQPQRPRPAACSEKAAHIEALTRAEYSDLLRCAKRLAARFSGRRHDADAEDLLHEATLRVIDRRNLRVWYPEKVDFLPFLRGCMRSVASEWYKRARTVELPAEVPSTRRYDTQTETAILLDQLRESVMAHPLALEIFDLRCLGLTAREIQAKLGVPKRLYVAAVKWIYRTLRRARIRKAPLV